MSVLLETVGLKKYFQTAAGKLHAVDDINLKIGKGETLDAENLRSVALFCAFSKRTRAKSCLKERIF